GQLPGEVGGPFGGGGGGGGGGRRGCGGFAFQAGMRGDIRERRAVVHLPRQSRMGGDVRESGFGRRGGQGNVLVLHRGVESLHFGEAALLIVVPATRDED